MTKSLEYRGQTLKIGDCVAMLPPDKKAKPFIASIEKFLVKAEARKKSNLKPDDYDVQVRWYATTTQHYVVLPSQTAVICSISDRKLRL